MLSTSVFDKDIRVLNNLPVSPQEEFSMRRRNRDRGFTLIELLIVVTIILIIAAFTIPKITKAQIPAHEASAIASIKAINAGQMIFSSSHPDVGFTPDLAQLGGTAQGGGEQTIDTNLASGRKSGYTFTYTPGEKVNGAIRSYTITAVPDQVGSTGQRRFFSDESGEIHYNGSGPADATSPVLQ
jgi:type IV pilus assembly protein PilA